MDSLRGFPVVSCRISDVAGRSGFPNLPDVTLLPNSARSANVVDEYAALTARYGEPNSILFTEADPLALLSKTILDRQVVGVQPHRRIAEVAGRANPSKVGVARLLLLVGTVGAHRGRRHGGQLLRSVTEVGRLPVILVVIHGKHFFKHQKISPRRPGSL